MARFPVRLYVETHIRSQLDHLIRCLRDQMLDPVQEARFGKIVASLEESSAKLTSWKRLRALFLQLPPVAAAVPVFITLLANPLSGVDLEGLVDAGLIILGSVLLVYVTVVWPSLKLGFRGKRALFSAGEDLAHPLTSRPGKAAWKGFPVHGGPVSDDIFYYIRRIFASGLRRRRRGRGTTPDHTTSADGDLNRVTAPETSVAEPSLEGFPRGAIDRERALRYAADAVLNPRLLEVPHVDVYRDEARVFNHLRRRKLQEVPIDLFLSLGPYLVMLVIGTVVAAYTSYLARGGAQKDPEWIAVAPLVVLFLLFPAQLLLQLRANLWLRRRPWEDPCNREPIDAPDEG